MKKAVLFLILLVLALASCDNRQPMGKFTSINQYGMGVTTLLDTVAGHEYVIAVSVNNGGGCAMQHAESCWCLKDTACFISGQCSYFVGDTDEGL